MLSCQYRWFTIIKQKIKKIIPISIQIKTRLRNSRIVKKINKHNEKYSIIKLKYLNYRLLKINLLYLFFGIYYL
jgi:hypothetical protein